MVGPNVSDDGYWEYNGVEWAPTMKQKFAIENGLMPHSTGRIFSDDGFWELINGEWQPTANQQILLQNTVYPTYQTQYGQQYQPQYFYANHTSNNSKALIFVAIGFALVILVSIILVVASLSPELATDEPEYEIGSGENKVKSFSWEYNDRYYSVDFILNEGTYNHFKYKYKYCCYDDEDYLRYVDTETAYIDEVAQILNTEAIDNGFTSDFAKADFILSFVGSIPYALDPDDDFDHPKFPIETLWENEGDCEDSSALYASIMESLGYRTVLVLLEAKAYSFDSWGYHAMVGIYIPGHSGDYFTLEGDWRNYYQAETTDWIEDESGVGIDPWYDQQNVTTLEIK